MADSQAKCMSTTVTHPVDQGLLACYSFLLVPTAVTISLALRCHNSIQEHKSSADTL